LLETLYERFDTLAKRFGVYKVETIGDCYMAVTGLPEPNAHHAVVAARFAYECIGATVEISKELEASLGPGTSDLALRIGLHSGTVTGGVLRGEKARFQLFGDTVNTAARMESNGVTGRVQVSQATADLIIGAGKEHWVLPRRTLVKAKGKGEMQVRDERR
jgi:class 3 adenylate cyclase